MVVLAAVVVVVVEVAVAVVVVVVVVAVAVAVAVVALVVLAQKDWFGHPTGSSPCAHLKANSVFGL